MSIVSVLTQLMTGELWTAPVCICSLQVQYFIFIFIFFVYCHLYSALSIVQCSNALYRLWDGEIQRHTGQPSVREIDARTMYSQWATAPGQSLSYPRPKSITHLRTFSDNDVYVALQLFLVIVVSDQLSLYPSVCDNTVCVCVVLHRVY